MFLNIWASKRFIYSIYVENTINTYMNKQDEGVILKGN